MLRVDFRLTWRTLARDRGHALLNIIGLTIGMTCCVLVMLWVQEELSFDRFHARSARIYRLYHSLTIGGTARQAPSGSAPMAPAIRASVPEVEDIVRLRPRPRTAVKREDHLFFEEEILYADPSVFDIFTFPLLVGDPKAALIAPYSVVLTEETAAKYFGDKDPIGETLTFDGNRDFTVTGVTKNIPSNSHLTFDMLCSFSSQEAEGYPFLNVWGAMGTYTYLLLRDQAQPHDVEKKLDAIIETNMGEKLRSVGASLALHLQPLSSVHLHSDFEGGTGEKIAEIRMFAGIGLFILVITCINFINLATARAAVRAKEVSIRKTLGATRSDLIRQFLGEAAVYSFLSLVLAVVLTHLTLPFFNSLAGQHLTMAYLSKPWLVPALVGLASLIALLAGSYPAFFLSSLEPGRILRDEQVGGASKGLLRQILVVVQFTIVAGCALGTVTVHRQLAFMRDTDLGFEPVNVVAIANLGETARSSLETLVNEMKNVDGVVTIGASVTPFGRSMMMMNFLPEGFSEDQNQLMTLLEVDEDFIPCLGIKMATGRNFSRDFPTDLTEAAIINETAALQFGWDSPVGKKIRQRVPGPSGHASPVWAEKTVIGTVKDFHFVSLRETIQPLFIARGNALSTIFIRMRPEAQTETLRMLHEKWSDILPNQPFDNFFLDQVLDDQYVSEQRLAGLTLSFTLVAVGLGCIGLFGISAYAAQRRTREIALRKVVGASFLSIVGLLSREFLVLVVIAIAAGLPVAHAFIVRWLNSFPYRVHVDAASYVIVAGAALVIAQVSVGVHVLMAARSNPATTLRHE